MHTLSNGSARVVRILRYTSQRLKSPGKFSCSCNPRPEFQEFSRDLILVKCSALIQNMIDAVRLSLFFSACNL